MKFEGIYTPVVTPYTDTHDIDKSRFADVINLLIQCGVHGLLIAGTTASVYSANVNRALRAARAIRAGTVTVNCYGEGDITTPFGGYKQSGFGGRYNGIYAHDQYTELKTIWDDLSDPATGDNVA